MKTLAAFKREIQPGQVWHGIHLAWNRDMGHREVVRKQSNAVTFRTPTGEESWLHFPKASDFREGPDGSIEIWEDGIALLRYRRVS